ncbi:MAG: PhzF family phenazine biosynthesis protein [Dongiaceae bacterium]
MLVPIQQIVTFASDPFHGNPAFVVTPARPLPPATLHQICHHLHEVMIAVLVPEGDTLTVRFATPTGFHSGAGHATHAAASVALRSLRPGVSSLDLRLDSGAHRSVRVDGDLISVDWPVMPYGSADLIEALQDALGVRPAATYDSSFGFIAVFDDDQIVARLDPDIGKIAALSADTVMVTAPSQSADFAIRVFAPKLGLPEDPVCGTAHRILVPFWATRTGRRTFRSNQLSPRGGELLCQLHDDVVTISGRAIPFLTGSIDLPV